MKILLFLLISASVFSQKGDPPIGVLNEVETSKRFYTNSPELVFSVLEEFISENHLRGTPVLEDLQKLDSVIVKDLGYI
jgi:hypothetical protein